MTEEFCSTNNVKNQFEVFETINDSLASLDHSQEIKIDLESTGHHHKSLVKFLTDKKHLQSEVYIANQSRLYAC